MNDRYILAAGTMGNISIFEVDDHESLMVSEIPMTGALPLPVSVAAGPATVTGRIVNQDCLEFAVAWLDGRIAVCGIYVCDSVLCLPAEVEVDEEEESADIGGTTVEEETDFVFPDRLLSIKRHEHFQWKVRQSLLTPDTLISIRSIDINASTSKGKHISLLLF